MATEVKPTETVDTPFNPGGLNLNVESGVNTENLGLPDIMADFKLQNLENKVSDTIRAITDNAEQRNLLRDLRNENNWDSEC